MYSFVFQEDYLQVCDELDTKNGKGNAIRLDVVKRVQVDELNNKRFINVAGIESPGLVSSPAIAEYVFENYVSKLSTEFILRDDLIKSLDV